MTWKRDKDQRKAVHESGTIVTGFSYRYPKGLYIVGEKTLELEMTYEGDGPEVGYRVLNAPPYHWNDGAPLTEDEETRFREIYTEGILFLGLHWINYN